MDRRITARRPDRMLINEKKKLLEQGVKIKESENMDRYLNFTRELKKLWNMRVTVIPIVTGALRTDYKGFEKSDWMNRNSSENGSRLYRQQYC